MTAARLTSSAETGPRWRVALLIGALVLAAHAWLLGAWPRAPGPGWRAVPPRPLQVRQIRLAAPPLQPIAAPAQSPPRQQRAAPVATDKTVPADALETPRAAADAEPAASPGGVDLPVYATRMPPPIELSFDLRRGGAGGTATLRWAPDADGYSLTLQGEASGQRLPGSTSRGGFDAAGLAPERYAESRRGRDLRAANFQRAAGRISFSGPAVEYPLVPGAQDRLSWIVQLAAVLTANPALAQPGAQVSMFVVGTRGDGEAWTFEVAGREAVDLADGERIEALRLQREPRRLYDTQVQVWLDPARHHLPVRLRLAVRADGEGREFLLRRAAPP